VRQAKSKVLILISDGEDFGENTQEIARRIENKGIALFTLGVGTEEGGRIQLNGGYKKDRQGNIVVSKLNSRSLRSLASQTGGQYFEINASRNDVARLINTIGQIEGEFREARFIDVTANRYFYFLGLAIILLVLDVLIPVHTFRILPTTALFGYWLIPSPLRALSCCCSRSFTELAQGLFNHTPWR